jgi:ubiquinone/menaquinone biosynthesis C-methylase UbiE
MSSIQLLQNKSYVPKEFDRVARSYDFATKMSQGYQDDLNTSAQRLKLKGNEMVLDLCCGTGKSTLACWGQLSNGIYRWCRQLRRYACRSSSKICG